MNNKKGQIWSIDLIIGVLIFAAIGISIYAFLAGGSDNDKISRYTEEAEALTEKLIDMGLINRDTGEFNQTVYEQLTQMDYEDLKDELGVRGDFCLYLEFDDDNPRLLIFNNKTGLGSSDFVVGDLPCGETI